MVNDKKSAVPKKSPPPGMDKPTRTKVKRSASKEPANPNPSKKRKCEGPSCSTFLAELSKKLSTKKKQEESRNIVQTIVNSITNALPVKFSKRAPPKKESPVQIETLQCMAPELISSDTVEIKVVKPEVQKGNDQEGAESAVVKPDPDPVSKMPHMPLKDSKDVLRISTQSKLETVAIVEDASVNTGGIDVAGELAKHVGTLKKISLIAEEFNQKTAKNLKEIVDSVQLDLLKKLEEIQGMERSASKYKEAASRPPSPPTSPILPLSVTLPQPTVPTTVEPMET